MKAVKCWVTQDFIDNGWQGKNFAVIVFRTKAGQKNLPNGKKMKLIPAEIKLRV